LQQVAADSRSIAQLGGGAGEQRFGDRRKSLAESRIIGEIGVAYTRANAHSAIRQRLDPVKPGQAADIDQPRRADDAALHQVNEVGAGRQIGATGGGGSRDGIRHGGRPDIVEAVHAASFRPA
jgi:hypothetical protein